MIRSLITQRENRGEIVVIEDGKSVLYRDWARKALTIQHWLPQGTPENAALIWQDINIRRSFIICDEIFKNASGKTLRLRKTKA